MRLGYKLIKGLLIAVPFFLVSTSGHGEEWRIDEDNFNAQRPPQLAVTAKGQPIVGFYDEDGNILVRSYRGDAVALNTSPERGKPSGLELLAAGERVYAAWRESRHGVSTLLLRVSNDGGKTWPEPEIKIDDTTQPLKRIVLAGDEEGNLHIAWLGERETDPSAAPGIATVTEEPAKPADKAAKNYHIYTRYSPDSGKTWGATYRLTGGYRESIWPTLIARGAAAYSFSWSQRGGRKLLLFTKTAIGSDWQTPSVIADVGDVLLLEPHLIDDRLLIIWLSHYPGKGYLIEGAVSEDNGDNWSKFSLPDSLGLDAANIDIAAAGNNVYLTFSARSKTQDLPKLNVYFARSVDGGHHWSRLTTLPHYPFAYTKAVYPRVIADPTVLVVWNDFRNIRGDLYYNYSLDAGANWQAQDIPLSPRGQRNDYIYPFNDALAKTGDAYYLLAGRYAGDVLAGQAELLLYRFTPSPFSSPHDLVGDTGSPAKTALLEQRAKRFWERLTAADYETVYGLFDPFYRANYRKVDYLAATGRIQFNSFQIKNIVVAGNLGRVIVDYEYEIPPFRTRQGKVSRPPTRVTQMEIWLFVDDNWYREYHNELGDFSFARY